MKASYQLCAICIGCTLASNAAADTPLGWINSLNSSAYTTTRGNLELSLGKTAVNDTLDVFNYREDLISTSGSLEGDSGDLSGTRLEAHYGITEDLSVFYKRQSHELSLELGEISSVDLIDIDDSLDTLAESIGLKWTFYRGNLLNSDNRHSAASIEISAFENSSDDFDAVVENIRLDNVTVIFGVPQTFSVADLEDSGWKARLIYSFPLQDSAVASFWAGYGQSDATSGTTSDLQSVTLSRFFEQSFELTENYLYFGAAITAHFSSRLLVDLSYEFTSISDSNLKRSPLEPPSGLPGFLSAGALSEIDDNHALTARMAYWLTPDISLSVTGNLYANQFVGVLPHYNNPLSGSFSSTPYGFAGMELLYNFAFFP